MGKSIELKAKDGFTLAAYRADPAGKPKGGLVVIQEIFGVNHHMRNVTDRFAASGYSALAPALFDRARRGVDIGYDPAAIDNLKGTGKIGVVGYCWGGSLAFLAATRLQGISGAVGYYGGMIAEHAKEKPKVPVMLHFGEQDQGIPMSDVEKVKVARPDVKIFTYPAGHGFSCDERGSFHKASHEQALERSMAFFKEHVG